MTAPCTLLFSVFLLPAALPAQCRSLIDAVTKRDTARTTSLLARGADPNCVDDSPVHNPKRKGKGKVEFYIQVRGWTPLMAAVQAGSTEAALSLLKAGANINAKNEYGATALDIAVVHGNSSDIAAAIFAAGGRGRDNYGIAVNGAPVAPPKQPAQTQAARTRPVLAGGCGSSATAAAADKIHDTVNKVDMEKVKDLDSIYLVDTKRQTREKIASGVLVDRQWHIPATPDGVVRAESLVSYWQVLSNGVVVHRTSSHSESFWQHYEVSQLSLEERLARIASWRKLRRAACITTSTGATEEVSNVILSLHPPEGYHWEENGYPTGDIEATSLDIRNVQGSGKYQLSTIKRIAIAPPCAPLVHFACAALTLNDGTHASGEFIPQSVNVDWLHASRQSAGTIFSLRCQGVLYGPTGTIYEFDAQFLSSQAITAVEFR